MNTYRLPEAGCFADYKEKVMDFLAGADGERGGPGQCAGMEVVWGMEKAVR